MKIIPWDKIKPGKTYYDGNRKLRICGTSGRYAIVQILDTPTNNEIPPCVIDWNTKLTKHPSNREDSVLPNYHFVHKELKPIA